MGFALLYGFVGRCFFCVLQKMWGCDILNLIIIKIMKGELCMKRTVIKSLLEMGKSNTQPDHEIRVCGWIKSLRSSKGLAFIMLNDGSAHTSLQVVAEEGALGEGFKEVVKQNVGAALNVIGQVVLTPNGKQPLEIHAKSVEVEAPSTPDYPLQKKQHTMEFLRTIAHLRPRTNTLSAVYRVRSVCAQAIHKFFHDQGFVYVHTPLITASDCEGAGEMFQVTTLDMTNPPKSEDGKIDYSQDFFGKKTFLTVSGQLEGEAMAMAFGNIYTFGPTFRAERSFTARHAAEFWMMEPEIAFADLTDNMDLAEEMLQYIIKTVLEECPDEIAFFTQFFDKELKERLEQLSKSAFARCTYTEAIELLEKSGKDFEFPISWGSDLQTEHERYLAEEVYGKPVFLTDYPKEIKSFYMRLNDDNKTVAAMDLLVPGIGELIGGSQREERMDVLEARMAECGLKPEDYGWYMDLRRYGGVKHAGFGLGFERLVMYMTATANIRESIPFPRTTNSCEF